MDEKVFDARGEVIEDVKEAEEEEVEEYDPFAEEFIEENESRSWFIPETTSYSLHHNSTNEEWHQKKRFIDNDSEEINNDSGEHGNGNSIDNDENTDTIRQPSKLLKSDESTSNSNQQLETSTSDQISPIDEQAEKNEENSNHNHLDERDTNQSSSQKQRVTLSEEEKSLWKSCWISVRKYLKPYLNRAQIRNKEDYEILSKKLAEKIYQKEKLRGTVAMNEKNSKRVQGYIKDYFSKYKTYQNNDTR